MKIKRILSILLLFTLLAFGQADRRDQIKALKSSRIAAALNLTASESQKFWPMYLNSEEKEYEIRHNKIRPLTNKLEESGIDELSQKEALLYLVKLEAADEEIVNLRKKLINDLKPVIGPKKILKLKKAEDDFNKLLLSKYKGKKD
jgi:hypothetical protein